VLTAILLLLVTTAAAGFFFGYFGRLRADLVSEGEGQLPELAIPPKLISLTCYDGYGYMLLTPSSGQGEIEGRAYYSVELDSGEFVKEGYLDLQLGDMEKVYLPVPFDTSERYVVELSAKQWDITETCTPFNDPHMVLYLPFDEGSGVRAEDTSDYDNHGFMNGTTWATGVTGGAAEFSGSDDHIEVPDDDSLDVTGGITVALWVKLGATSNWQTPVNKYWMDCWEVSLSDTLTPRFGLVNSTGNRVTLDLTGTAITSDTWTFLTMTYEHDGGYIRGYVDGSEANTTAQTGRIGTNDLPIILGVRSEGPNYPVNGTIDDVRVYSRALSADEIAALYQAYMGGAI